MSRAGKRLLFSLIPLVVVLGGVEAGLRAAGWPSAQAAFEHNEPFWRADPDLVGEAFPHREEASSFSVSTNADGLRAPGRGPDKAEGAWRVLALGCSTTFGWGVDDAEAYPQQLEALARAAGHERVEVINGGQPGYTTFQGRWLWSELLAGYHADVVLLGYVVQDARTAAYSDRSQAVLQQDARFLKDNLLYRSRLYLGLRSLLGGVQLRAKERAEGQGVYRVPPEDYAENLRALVAGVRATGAEPVLFGYPLEREGYTATHRRILQAAASELGVKHLDPQARMEEASRTATLYFQRDRGHANAAGSALIARWVLEFLVEQDLLGDGP